MISAKIALDLVDRLSTHLDYNVNIMDDRGVIIASRDKSRIGDYHEAAYRIVESNESIEVIYPEDSTGPGVKPGVNLPIAYHGRVIGVVGITGNPPDVLNLAYAVKISVESIVEHEMFKEEVTHRQDIKNRFRSVLLHDEAATSGELENLASKLGYVPSSVRVPIVFRSVEPVDTVRFLATLQHLPSSTRQDISFSTASQDILVFRFLNPVRGNILAQFRSSVAAFVRELENELKRRNALADFRVGVGTLQNRLERYRSSYEKVLWLLDRPESLGRKVSYFNDHVRAYVRGLIPNAVFHDIFSVVCEVEPRLTSQRMASTIDALARNNMNIQEAAAALSVHRNTVRSRLDSMYAELDIDPVRNPADRDYVRFLAEYLKL